MVRGRPAPQSGVVRFPKMIAEDVQSATRKGGYGRLTRVAGPAVLPDIRREISDRLRARIAPILHSGMIDSPLRHIAGQFRAVRSFFT